MGGSGDSDGFSGSSRVSSGNYALSGMSERAWSGDWCCDRHYKQYHGGEARIVRTLSPLAVIGVITRASKGTMAVGLVSCNRIALTWCSLFGLEIDLLGDA